MNVQRIAHGRSSVRSHRGRITASALVLGLLAFGAHAPANAADGGEDSGPRPIAAFDFEQAPIDGAFVDGDIRATVHGTAQLVKGQDGVGTAAQIGPDFWLDVADADGSSPLRGLDEVTISYDSNPNTSGNTGWTVYAAASVDRPSLGNERYLGYLDTASSVVVERYNNSGGQRDTSGNLRATGSPSGWKHVDLVVGGTGAKLYIDRQLVSESTRGPVLGDILGADGGILQIGKANWGAGEYFSGQIDNLSIYPRALTAVELGLPAPQAIELSAGEDLRIWTGETSRITAAVLPEGAEQSVVWSSSDAAVAAVAADGTVTAGAVGTAVLTASAEGFPEISATVTVDVEEKDAERAAQRDLDAIVLHNADDIRGNIAVPVFGAYGSTITWTVTEGGEYARIDDGVSDRVGTVRVDRPAAGLEPARVTLTATVVNEDVVLAEDHPVTVQPMPTDVAEDSAYIWAFFTGEGVGGEKISFAASKGNDALDWNSLNEGTPLFASELGEKGLRDPFILRSPDGDKFYLIATDLKIDGRQGGFRGAQTHGSLHIEVWESNDLVDWSEQRHVKVSSEHAGNTWAPEAYWDEELDTYVVYWASNLYESADAAERGSTPNYNRMMYATTDDFVSFSEPEIWIDVDRRGQDGAGSIDVTVAQVDDAYIRIYKDEKSMTLRQETSTDLLDTVIGAYPETSGDVEGWVEMGQKIGHGQPNGYGGTFDAGEGPSLFPANPRDVNGYQYYLFADQPDYHGGPNHYVPMATKDIEDAGAWTVIGDEMPAENLPVNSDGGRPRHGTVLPVTRTQYQAVLEAYAPQIAVLSVEAVDVETEVGAAPQLPESVRLNKADGSVEDAVVVWEAVSADDYAQSGSFSVSGIAQDDSRQPVEAVVAVIDPTQEVPTDNPGTEDEEASAGTDENDGALAATGQDPTPWAMLALALIAAGLVFSLRRRRGSRVQR